MEQHGEYEEAMTWLEKNLLLREKMHGTDSKELISSLQGGGLCAQKGNEKMKALRYFQRAKDLVQKVEGTESKLYARCTFVKSP